jgi:hypothetical protein
VHCHCPVSCQSPHPLHPASPSTKCTTTLACIIMSSGRGHQPSMHDLKDKTDMVPRATGSRKPPEDKITAKDAGPASKEKGEVKRTKSTDKKSVSCSMNLHRHLVILTFEAHLCDILGRECCSWRNLRSMPALETRYKVLSITENTGVGRTSKSLSYPYSTGIRLPCSIGSA